MSVKVKLELVVQQLTEALADAEKADSGNKAANHLKDLRKLVLEVRKEG
mgnify:CR=1 FL=1